MKLGHLIGTSPFAASCTDAERRLVAVARAAAVLGVTLACVGVLVLVLAPFLRGPTVDLLLGGGGTAVGGALWVLAQGSLAHWVGNRHPQSLFAAARYGAFAVLAAWIGFGMLVGFSLALVVAALVVAVAELKMVAAVDPAWATHLSEVYGGSAGMERGKPVQGSDEVIVLRWVATAALSTGVGAGVAVAFMFVYYAIALGEGFNFFGAYASVWFMVAVVVWNVPHLALLRWTGASTRLTDTGVLVGAAAWAGLIWVSSALQLPDLTIPVLVGVVVVLEVVLTCMIRWPRPA